MKKTLSVSMSPEQFLGHLQPASVFYEILLQCFPLQ